MRHVVRDGPVTIETPAGSVVLSAGDDIPADCSPQQLDTLINLGVADRAPDATSPASGARRRRGRVT